MKRRSFTIFLILAIVLTISGCSSTAEPVQTRVVIDGKGEDWSTYLPIVNDFKDDQASGTPDLGEIRAFCNDQYLYVNIKLNQDGETDHYDLLLNTGGGTNFTYQLSVWPKKNEARFGAFPVTEMHLVDGVTSAQDEVIEVKMPLSLVDGKKVTWLLVQTYNQNTKTVDDMAQGAVQTVKEVETIQSTPIP